MTEVIYDFVFTPPASANRVPEFGYTGHWNPFAYRAVRI